MKTSPLAQRRRWYHSASLYLWMARAGPAPDPACCFPVPFSFFSYHHFYIRSRT